MALNKYEVFVQVAEKKNLTQVAKELDYTQSAISHSIQSLEKELGLPLIRRSKNCISLTQYGKDLLPDFRQIINDNEKLYQKVSQFKGLQRGTLRVGAFTSVSMHWMPLITKRILDEYPDIHLIQSHSGYSDIERDLAEGRIDIGFLSGMYKGIFEFLPLIEDEFMVLVPPGHYLSKYERIPIEALSGERIVMMDEGGQYDLWNIYSQIKNVNLFHFINEDFLALPLVENGVAITIMSKFILDCCQTSAVIKSFAVPRYRTVGLAMKSFKDASPLAKFFVSLVREIISQKTP